MRSRRSTPIRCQAYRAAQKENPIFQAAESAVNAFKESEGRAPSLLVAKIGQDGHDRGQKVIATGFSDLGFEVKLGELFATAQEVAKQAVANNCHIVGVSSLAAGHLSYVPQLKAALAKLGRDDMLIVVGGVIPPDDVPLLMKMGASAIFLPGTVIAEAAQELLQALNIRLGYAQKR